MQFQHSIGFYSFVLTYFIARLIKKEFLLLILFKIGNGSIELNFHLLWHKKFYSRLDWIALDLNDSIAIIEGSDVLDYPWTSLQPDSSIEFRSL